MPIIQHVMPSKNKAIKKLLHFYLEVCPKLDENGKLKQEMILVWFVLAHFVVGAPGGSRQQRAPERPPASQRVHPRRHPPVPPEDHRAGAARTPDTHLPRVPRAPALVCPQECRLCRLPDLPPPGAPHPRCGRAHPHLLDCGAGLDLPPECVHHPGPHRPGPRHRLLSDHLRRLGWARRADAARRHRADPRRRQGQQGRDADEGPLHPRHL
jgi:hypothetical protein